MSKSEDPLDDSITVVKTSTCETLTRKSKLTYQIGTLPDGEVYVRIHKNSGNGFPLHRGEILKRPTRPA